MTVICQRYIDPILLIAYSSGNRIYNIFKDSGGEAWIATDKSLDKYVYGNNQFLRYTINSRPTFVTYDSNEIVWVGTIEDGLFEIEKNRKTTTIDFLL